MSSQKIYKFVFTAHIKTVSLALKFPCVLGVTWRRGSKKSEVKQRRQIERGIATFEQPLELEVNMPFNTSTNKFEKKQTLFTINIFSQKGNKQAGQATICVDQMLNAKAKSLNIVKDLDKCPDKNAKMTFTLSGYMKQQIQPDSISHESTRTVSNSQLSVITPSTIKQPDFKKKKNDQSLEKEVPSNTSRSVEIPKQRSDQNIPQVSKENRSKLKLQEENKKLKQELNQLRQIQFQNENLRRKLSEADKKSSSYYLKKFQEMKKEYNEFKEKAKRVQLLVKKKQDFEQEMCQCKEKMGRILNFAIMSGNNEMTEEIYNIYQKSD